MFAALDVSQEETAICVVRQDGTHVAEAKVPTCPDAIADWLTERTEGLERVGMETGPLAVWLWNAPTERHVPIICMDARHVNGVLKMMPNKTDRHYARGLAQIVRIGWFKAAQIKSHDAYVNRAMLTAREALVGMRVRLENEIRGLLKTFGIMFGKRVGGFERRAEEIIEGELAVGPGTLADFRGPDAGQAGHPRPHRRTRQSDPRSGPAACDGPPADDGTRRGTDHGDGGYCGLR
jgi:transposase